MNTQIQHDWVPLMQGVQDMAKWARDVSRLDDPSHRSQEFDVMRILTFERASAFLTLQILELQCLCIALIDSKGKISGTNGAATQSGVSRTRVYDILGKHKITRMRGESIPLGDHEILVKSPTIQKASRRFLDAVELCVAPTSQQRWKTPIQDVRDLLQEASA